MHGVVDACSRQTCQVLSERLARGGHAFPEEARDVNFNPAGQIIGAATSVRRTKDVVLGMVEEYVDALDRLQAMNEGVTA